MRCLLLFLFTLIILAACGEDGPMLVNNPEEDIVENFYDETHFPGTEWNTAPAGEVGMNVDKLEEGLDYVFMPALNTQGVVVIRHGQIVAERYAAGRNASTIATSWSTAKSFASALVGVAIDEGYIQSVDDLVSTYLEEWKGTAKENISLRAILEMRSGLELSPNEVVDLYVQGGNQGDQLGPSIFRDVEIAPHMEWEYQNANSMLLGEIVSRASGMDTQKFAKDFLFSKIGMDATWWQDGAGHTLTYCCIDATTRDFARFGLLFVREGQWNSDHVVSGEWVEESTSSMAGYDSYGLHWVVNNNLEMYAAAGLHQNNIYVFPNLDMVVVRNSLYNRIGVETIRVGGNYHETFEPMNWMSLSFIQPIIDAVVL